MTTNNNRYFAYIITAVTIILIIVFTWFISKHFNKCEPQPVNTRSYDSTILSQQTIIAGNKAINSRLLIDVQRLQHTIDSLTEARILNASKKQQAYEKVNNTPDSGQCALLHELSARLQQFEP